MPVYDYKCDKCSKQYEDWSSTVTERDNQKCPECGSLMVRTVAYVTRTIFGDSFYNAGETKRAHVKITDKDGKQRIVDITHKI